MKMRDDEFSSAHLSLEHSLSPREIQRKIYLLHNESKEKDRKLNELRKTLDKVLLLLYRKYYPSNHIFVKTRIYQFPLPSQKGTIILFS